jgi:alkylhydroperoxidase family enzyme
VLLRVYDNADVVRAIAEDPDSAPIPDMHKLAYRWTEKFVKRPWQLDSEDIAMLRGAGLSDREVTQWAVRAASQSWFTMCADGAGVDLDGGLSAGPAVGRERIAYEKDCAPVRFKHEVVDLVGDASRRSEAAWVETNETSELFRRVQQVAEARWGTVPFLLRAISSLPEVLDTYSYMLQLLEGPQSNALPPKTHALVRAEVATINKSTWSAVTINELLAQNPVGSEFIDQMAIGLAQKLVLTPWKVTEKDAATFRDAGLADEVYLDVLNTTAIQNALDRLSWALGVPDDSKPLLATA